MLNHTEELLRTWETDPRWRGIVRPYRAEDVERLRGTVRIEYTLARMGAERLWHLLHTEPYVAALGALTGNQAVQQVQAWFIGGHHQALRSPHPQPREIRVALREH